MSATAPFEVTPGNININVLYQDEVWVDIRGNVKYLTDMDAGHRINTLLFLECRAVKFHRWACDLALFDAMVAFGRDEDNFEGWTANDPIFEDPDRWLARQPLVRRLAELVELDLSRPFAEQRLRARNWLWSLTHSR
jgi:hypothetical protein